MIEIDTQPWLRARDAAYAIRYAVFVEEQGIPVELEIDDFDSIAEHALAYYNGRPVGTARVYINQANRRQATIGRMAVLAEYRKQGIGKALLGEVIRAGIQAGASEFILHAQLSAVPFYAQLKFKPDGAIFDEVGIAHQCMRLVLDLPAS